MMCLRITVYLYPSFYGYPLYAVYSEEMFQTQTLLPNGFLNEFCRPVLDLGIAIIRVWAIRVRVSGFDLENFALR